MLRQAFVDQSAALIVLFFLLKVVQAVDVAQLQAGIDLLPLNSAALEQFRQSSEPSKTFLELAFLSTLLVPTTVQLVDALRAVNLQPRVWKSSFPALAPEIENFMQALNGEYGL